MVSTQALRGTNNFCVFRAFRTGCSWDQDPTCVISKYNSLICYFSFAENYIKKIKSNNCTRVAVPQQQYNSNSVQICAAHPIPSASTDLSRALFLHPYSSIAALTAKPLAPSPCNTAWLRAAWAAEMNPPVATSKKTSWSSLIPGTHKYSTSVCLICH